MAIDYGSNFKEDFERNQIDLIEMDLNDENSNLIVSDSAFVNGQKYQYNSGIISDASVNQNSFADYYVTVNIPSDKIVKYHLKEVRWEYYE